MTSRRLFMPGFAVTVPSVAWAQERPWVLLVRWLAGLGGGREDGGRTDWALEILRERYARGEIDREEFESRKRDLT